MSLHTSMKVGGPATVFFEPDNESEFLPRLHAFQRAGMPYIVIGNGTNIIVRDGGYPGAVFSTRKALRGIEVTSGRLVCGAGESLANVGRFAAGRGLTGMEALSGIPGTVGGAIVMNAGAYDSEISNILVSTRVYDISNDQVTALTNKECEFNYRDSIFKRNQMVILSAEFELLPGNRAEIEAKMADFIDRRNSKQPVELPSAGSFFKRPEGYFAGKLIEEIGMKGARVGGAQVSEKHAGFIVNTGGATATDVLTLAEEIKAKVYEQTGISLEEEPIVIGI